MYTQKIQGHIKYLKNRLILIYKWFRQIVTKVFDSIVSEEVTLNNRFVFFNISWILCLLFYIGFFLADKNPYSIFIPFSLYELPRIDSRTEATLFLSDGKGSFLPVKRKVLLYEDSINKNVTNLLRELGELPFLSKQDDSSSLNYSVSLKKLPNLAIAIITSWYLEKDSKIILDLSQNILEDEIRTIKIYKTKDEFFKDKKIESQKNEPIDEDELIRQHKLKILAAAFVAAERTIFTNFENINNIEYRLDGKVQDYPGLAYRLSERKIRKR